MQLFDLALCKLTFEGRHPIKKYNAVAMIRFMQYTPCGQVLNIYFYLFAINILCPGDHSHLSRNRLEQARKRQTPFVTRLFTLDADDLRIYQNMPLPRTLVRLRRVHHKQPPRNPNLRCGQPDTSGIRHRIEHILDQYCEIPVKIIITDWLCD